MTKLEGKHSYGFVENLEKKTIEYERIFVVRLEYNKYEHTFLMEWINLWIMQCYHVIKYYV